MEYLENGDKSEDAVEQGARIGHQWLLVIHGQGCNEQLGGRQAAPGNSQASQHEPRQAPATHRSARLTLHT